MSGLFRYFQPLYIVSKYPASCFRSDLQAGARPSWHMAMRTMGFMGSKFLATGSCAILLVHWCSNFGMKMSLTMMAVSMLLSPAVSAMAVSMLLSPAVSASLAVCTRKIELSKFVDR